MSWSQLVPEDRRNPHRVAIAPSMLAANFSTLDDEVRAIEEAGADMLHLDVMDGHFVPNISFGPFIVAAIRSVTDMTLDTHLMIENPDKYNKHFVEAGSDIITIHVEASTDVRRDLSTIRGHGKKCGLTLNPDTPMERVTEFLGEIDLFLIMSVFPGFGGRKFIADVLSKAEEARRLREANGWTFAIEIDGGIGPETAPPSVEAGVDILVAGTSVFESPDYAATIHTLRGENG